jgi:hypothetical protein
VAEWGGQKYAQFPMIPVSGGNDDIMKALTGIDNLER